MQPTWLWRFAMRTIPITAAALVVLRTAEFAQMSPSRDNTTTPGPRTSTSAPATTTAPAQRAVQINPLTQAHVAKIEGTSVHDGDDGKIVHVSHVLMNPHDKKIY